MGGWPELLEEAGFADLWPDEEVVAPVVHAIGGDAVLAAREANALIAIHGVPRKRQGELETMLAKIELRLDYRPLYEQQPEFRRPLYSVEST